PTAAAALGAAVAGQRALAVERWERDRPLRVRMAVHAGVAQCRAGNYFGPTLNRTARLLACAWGGQIVCSAAGADLAADELPGEVTLVDLGDHRLADLARPERVFQVVHPGLPGDFPRLRSLDAPRHNLPAALTSFIGRAGELDEIAGHIGRSRLVTLVGPGGAGKTRFSLEVARVVLDRFPDGAWLAELAPVRDVTVMGHVVASAVGFDLSALAASGRPFTEALCEQLQHRRLLIVLDNCEHLLAAAADLTHAIVTRCPGVVVLATSREVLAVAGEHVVRLGPLSLPADEGSGEGLLESSDAVRLFCERARESAAGFVLTEANAAAVSRICRRLDGMPLALELAAARVRLLGAQALAERLDDRFRLLAGGPRTADPRHQTLQAAVDWSHDLLSEPERIVLRRLAVFPSDFSLEAAEAVSAANEEMEGPAEFEVLDVLGRLTDKSLVVAADQETSGVRYHLLETVRQYAAVKLAEAGESEALRRRHRDFFSRHPGSIHEIADVQRLRWAEAEADNVRTALEWAREADDAQAILRLAAPQGLYWMFSGTADGTQWLERAVAAPGTGDVGLRVQARCGLGMLLQEAGGEPGSRSVPLVREAVALADACGDEPAATWARVLLGNHLAGQGEVQEAEAHTHRALETFRAHADRRGQGYAHAFLGTISLAGGDLARARDHLETGSALFGDVDDYMVSHVAGILALLDAVAGNADPATSRAAQAVSVARRLPGRQILVMALTRSAQAAVISGRIDEARESLDELLGLLRELGARRWVGDALELTAIILTPSRAQAASVLMGAITSLRGSLHEEGSFLPVLSERLAAASASVTAALSAGHVAEHERRGATMHLDQILAYAWAELRAETGHAVP
ncbi:MAG: ATP-binding protein, partial [Acidimicrobiia bacterium]